MKIHNVLRYKYYGLVEIIDRSDVSIMERSDVLDVRGKK